METPNDLNELTKIIYFKDIKRLGLLPYSANSTIKKFCKKNNVAVCGTTQKFVFTVQFVRACMQSQVEELKRAYGTDWLRVLQSDMKMIKELQKTAQCLKPKQGKTGRITEPGLMEENKITTEFQLDLGRLTEYGRTDKTNE